MGKINNLRYYYECKRYETIYYDYTSNRMCIMGIDVGKVMMLPICFNSFFEI